MGSTCPWEEIVDHVPQEKWEVEYKVYVTECSYSTRYFGRQVAFAAPRCERSAAPTAAPSQCMRKVDHFPMSDVRNTGVRPPYPSLAEIRHSRKSTEK